MRGFECHHVADSGLLQTRRKCPIFSVKGIGRYRSKREPPILGLQHQPGRNLEFGLEGRIAALLGGNAAPVCRARCRWASRSVLPPTVWRPRPYPGRPCPGWPDTVGRHAPSWPPTSDPHVRRSPARHPDPEPSRGRPAAGPVAVHSTALATSSTPTGTTASATPLVAACQPQARHGRVPSASRSTRTARQPLEIAAKGITLIHRAKIIVELLAIGFKRRRYWVDGSPRHDHTSAFVSADPVPQQSSAGDTITFRS